MIENTTLQDLRKIWEEANRKTQMLEEELAQSRAEQAACELIISLHTVKDNAVGQANLHHAHILPSLLMNCATHEEAFREIAQRSYGTVRVSEASRLVHAAGLSKGKASSIVSSMSTRLANSDDWEYVDPGTFRLLAYESMDISSPEPNDDDIRDEQWPEESLPTGDDVASPYTSPVNGETEAKVGE